MPATVFDFLAVLARILQNVPADRRGDLMRELTVLLVRQRCADQRVDVAAFGRVVHELIVGAQHRTRSRSVRGSRRP
jgi:hypothetical protein